MFRRALVQYEASEVSLPPRDFSPPPVLLSVKEDLENGEEVATCPSCSLIVKVIYDKVRQPN